MTIRVRASQAAAKPVQVEPALVGRQRGASRPPGRPSCSQGYWFVGNSSARVTTLSPGCQGKPSATKLMPSVVLRTRAISSRRAPIRRAASSRTCSTRRDPVGIARVPIPGGVVGPLGDGGLGGTGQGGDGRMVEIGPLLGDRHLAAKLRPSSRPRFRIIGSLGHFRSAPRRQGAVLSSPLIGLSSCRWWCNKAW